mmetsp:Transcript_27407/g.91089  ORF Transcript_27407/g.91089 Transcript_27407/m.91089 type:complete len:353 (+) Transcript_27407:742-1800(+)
MPTIRSDKSLGRREHATSLHHAEVPQVHQPGPKGARHLGGRQPRPAHLRLPAVDQDVARGRRRGGRNAHGGPKAPADQAEQLQGPEARLEGSTCQGIWRILEIPIGVQQQPLEAVRLVRAHPLHRGEQTGGPLPLEGLDAGAADARVQIRDGAQRRHRCLAPSLHRGLSHQEIQQIVDQEVAQVCAIRATRAQLVPLIHENACTGPNLMSLVHPHFPQVDWWEAGDHQPALARWLEICIREQDLEATPSQDRVSRPGGMVVRRRAQIAHTDILQHVHLHRPRDVREEQRGAAGAGEAGPERPHVQDRPNIGLQHPGLSVIHHQVLAQAHVVCVPQPWEKARQPLLLLFRKSP